MSPGGLVETSSQRGSLAAVRLLPYGWHPSAGASQGVKMNMRDISLPYTLIKAAKSQPPAQVGEGNAQPPFLNGRREKVML